jgi:hypothetical protein
MSISDKDIKERVGTAIKRLESGTKEVNLTDEDARLTKNSQRRFQPSYNSQIAVDSNQIIVAAGVGNNSDDTANFQMMVKQNQNNVEGEIGKVLVDGGYYSKGNMGYLMEAGLDVYMPMGKGRRKQAGKFGREDFRYERLTDSYQCPAGQSLRYQFSRHKDGVETRLYRCSSSKCQSCRLKSRCTTGRVRDLNISAVWPHEQVMQEKLRTKEGRAVYNRRQVLVEPVFGNMKFNMGFAGFVLRGLKKVKGEFLLMCIAHNLKKISRWWRQLEPALGSKKVLSAGRHLLLRLFWSFSGILSNLWANLNLKLEYA